MIWCSVICFTVEKLVISAAGMVLFMSWIFYSTEGMLHFSNNTKHRNPNQLMGHWDTYCQLKVLKMYMTILTPKIVITQMFFK